MKRIYVALSVIALSIPAFANSQTVDKAYLKAKHKTKVKTKSKKRAIGGKHSQTKVDLSNIDPLTSMPMSDMFWELYRERYILGQNDCSNKSGRYAVALCEAGYDAEILIVQPYNSRYKHAIVCVKCDKGHIHYLDPTYGTIGRKLEDIGELKQVIPSDKFDQLDDSFR